MSGSQLHHVPQLDGIRAIAVLLVMLSHSGLDNIPGGFGVTIFFFLSGYLITTLLRVEWVKSDTIDLRAFYLRRVLRIMPPLYVTLIILTVLYPFGVFGRVPNWPAVTWDYLFLSNYSHVWGQEGGLPVPLWSLAIEEHFYLLFPFCFIALAQRYSMRRIAQILGIACVVILGLRFATLIFTDDLSRNYYWSHTRLDSLLFGCCLALWQNPMLDPDAWKPKNSHVAAAVLAVLATFLIRDPLFRETIRYSIQGIALFVLFSFVLEGRSALVTKLLSWKPVAWIGLVSYTLYLCHTAIFAAVHTVLGVSELEAALIGTPLAFLFAHAMRVAVELPVLRWRKAHQAKVKSMVAPATA